MSKLKAFLLGSTAFCLLAIIYADAPLEPLGVCKTENAECNVNDSGKRCCPGLTCMDKDVPSDIGKCGYLPTATPTPTNTPTPTVLVCEPKITVGDCEYTLVED